MLPCISYDTETTGLALHHGAKLFAWSTCTEAGETHVGRVDGKGIYKNPAQARAKLDEFWQTPNPKAFHNAKFDLTASENFLGRSLYGQTVHDTHKMSHILQNHHQTHTLDHIAWELGNYERVDGKVKQMGRELGGFHKIPEHIMDKYQRLDAERCMAIYLFFWPKIQANPAWLDCYNTECELTWTTMRMEKRGLMVHAPRTRVMITELEAKSETAREELFRIAGRRFNPDSDPEVRRLLYGTGKGQFGLPILGYTAKSHEPSLDKRILLQLIEKAGKDSHGGAALDAILRARSYAKGVTVLESYLTLAGSEGIIHPTLNTCAAITGRQSSENPNLQNVQTSGRLDNPYPVLARHAFRPRPGYINLHIDYSGIEMRLLVHYAGEEEMIRCMTKGDGDVHALGAESYYQEAYSSLPKGPDKKALRNRAKNGGFAQAYGVSPTKLAGTLGLPPEEGKAAYARYRARFPKLAGISKTIIGLVRGQGYVDSVFGRRLHVPKGEAYVGTNYLIQGTAGEVLKRAEIRVDNYNRTATGDEVRLLLPIHDELVIEYPRARLSDLGGYLRDIRSLMIGFPQFSVPLDVEASTVITSWEQKRPYKIPG